MFVAYRFISVKYAWDPITNGNMSIIDYYCDERKYYYYTVVTISVVYADARSSRK